MMKQGKIENLQKNVAKNKNFNEKLLSLPKISTMVKSFHFY